jgi:hypothetical protein
MVTLRAVPMAVRNLPGFFILGGVKMKNPELVDLKAIVKEKVLGLRYLYNVMESATLKDYEPCINMAIGYLSRVADDLDQLTKE